MLLNQFEPGMTVEKLDQVFDQVKQGIQEIRTVLAEKVRRLELTFYLENDQRTTTPFCDWWLSN